MKKIYTAKQMMLGSFFGGPIAAIYFLKIGFDAIGRQDFAKRSLSIGIPIMFAYIALLPYIPEGVPSYAISIFYAIPVMVLSKDYFFTKMQIEQSTEFNFQSSWKVFGISLLTACLFTVIAVACFYVFESIGFITLE